MKSVLLETATLLYGGVGILCGVNAYQGNPTFYSKFIMPHVHWFCSPETAHNLAIKLASKGFVPKCREQDDPILKSKVFGKTFNNPIGIAAGFDKHAEAMVGLEKIGFGFIEVGSVTPLPQDGNKKPRVFRLIEDNAVINRYGFNSCGHKVAAKRLQDYTSGSSRNIVLGVNLGKNKTSKSATDDYVKGVDELGRYADYIVINVSSPNTPGLRNLQKEKELENICTSVLNARNKLSNSPPVLVKLAPDLTDEDKQGIANVVLKTSIDGLIISNTTVARPKDLKSKHKKEAGGLSGEPLKEMSTALINDMYVLTKGKVPIIGVGGIWSGFDAYDKIRSGASLVQIYTSLIYEGPPLVGSIKKELSYYLKRDGFSNVSDAVGYNHR